MKADHFSIFVYPFEHGLPPKGRDHFLARAWKAGWRSWICRLSGGQELLTLRDRLKAGSMHTPSTEKQKNLMMPASAPNGSGLV